MSRKSNARRAGVSALVASTGLLLAGCGGSPPAVSSTVVCSSFTQAYQSFLAGATPPLHPGNAWDELINASGNIFGATSPAPGVGDAVVSLMNSASTTTDDLSNGLPASRAIAQFNGDLTKIGKDCRTTFTPATASS